MFVAHSCSLDTNEFLCKDGKTCLPINKVCDNTRDCPNGDDEDGECKNYKNNKDCKQGTCPSESECYVTPTGTVCACNTGYRYNDTNRSCYVCFLKFFLQRNDLE